ncbi:putative reverse transcriptase domain-containing protein, partial [Tanacetum coccineum]
MGNFAVTAPEQGQTLKDILSDAPILALPEGPDDFVVYCDASNQGKANVVADALSRKEWMKPRRVRAMSITIHSSIKARILKTESEASKDINTLTEMLTLIMDKAHAMKYSVHYGADKMYYDLRDLYWWPGMKKDIATYVSKSIREDYKMERFARLCINEIKALGMQLDMSIADYPQTDGQSERIIYTLEDMLRVCAIDF